MKSTVSRASLVTVLMVALLMSLIPLTRADSEVSPAPQDTAAAHPRRGKNGQLSNASTQNQSTLPASQGPVPVQGSKPQSQQAAPPSRSGDARSSSRESSWPAASQTDATQVSAGSQEREAPPFDRPPLRTQGRARSNSTERNAPAPSASRQSSSGSDAGSYPRADSRSQPADRSQSSTSTRADRNRFPDSSSGGVVDTDRSSGLPPVLRRPSDSRQRDGASSDSAARPPVLRRPSDASRDESGSSDVRVERPSASSQQQGGTGQQQSGGDDEVIKLESTLVNIPLLVSDRSGRYIPQLSARDFLLYEDGVEQKIASFGSEQVPFSLVLLLDVSPSVAGSVQDIQDAAIEFVRQLRAQDRVMVASFDRHIHYLSDFTNDRRELEWAIRKANTGSGTSVYDAVYETVNRKLRNIEGRKALILFSDGEDTTSSVATYDDAVDLVAESDVLVYGLRYPGGGGGGGGGVRVDPWPRTIPGLPIPLPFPWPWPAPRRRRGPFNITGSGASGAASTSTQSWPRRRGRGGDFMADITAAGGGPVYDAQQIGDLSRIAYRIADELRHVYVISYYPTNPLSNGGFRKVRISVRSRDDIAVRHRPGYNARPTGSAKPTI